MSAFNFIKITYFVFELVLDEMVVFLLFKNKYIKKKHFEKRAFDNKTFFIFRKYVHSKKRCFNKSAFDKGLLIKVPSIKVCGSVNV
jgi:hypothetical protein